MNNKYIETFLKYSEMPLLEYISSICKYAGSKKRLLFYIRLMINICKACIVIDLCGGSGIVSMNISPSHKIINDISVINAVVYKVLSNRKMSNELSDKINSHVPTYEDYHSAYSFWHGRHDDTLNNFAEDELVSAAYHALIILWSARLGSKLHWGKKPESLTEESCKNIMDRLTNEWNARHNKISSWNIGMNGATVYNQSMIDILKDYVDHPEKIKEGTLIYCDPPYLTGKSNGHKTWQNTYTNTSFNEELHREMLTLLDKLPRDKCKVVVSGYDSELYDEVLSSDGFGVWTKLFVKELTVNAADGSKLKDGKRPTAKEYFFTNFRP